MGPRHHIIVVCPSEEAQSESILSVLEGFHPCLVKGQAELSEALEKAFSFIFAQRVLPKRDFGAWLGTIDRPPFPRAGIMLLGSYQAYRVGSFC